LFCECKGTAFSQTVQAFHRKNGGNTEFSCCSPLFSAYDFQISIKCRTFASVFKPFG